MQTEPFHLVEPRTVGVEPVERGHRNRQRSFCCPALVAVVMQLSDMNAFLLEAQRQPSKDFVDILSDDYFGEIHDVRFSGHFWKVVVIASKSMV